MAQTTTTTTTTTTVTTTISLNTSYLVPQGILKIIEIIVCIIVFALVAAARGVYMGSGPYDGVTFGLAVGIIFFLTTLILLIFFLFNITAKLGGNKIWFIIDTVLNVLAVVLFFIAAIILFVYCTYTWGSVTLIFGRLIAAGVFSLVAFILYILSIVLAMKAGQTPMISIKA